MTPLKRMKDPNTLIQIGLVFMILAGLARWFLGRSAVLPVDLADGVTGFLYGITIGSLLLGLYRRGRRRAG